MWEVVGQLVMTHGVIGALAIIEAGALYLLVKAYRSQSKDNVNLYERLLEMSEENAGKLGHLVEDTNRVVEMLVRNGRKHE